MKNLTLISFVGVDQQTNLDDLKYFSTYSRIYEFGILHSETRNGADKRYPTHDFTQKYLKWAKDNDVYTSLHLCGGSINKYLTEDKNIFDIANLAGRIQLNLNIQKYDINLLSDKIIKIADKYNHKIILQDNSSKKKFNELFLSKKFDFFLSLLYDSSGGYNKKIEKILPPYQKYFTGYAGGINPDNVLDIIDIIDQVNIYDYPYYIDMESGVRENNLFSIEKCKNIFNLIESRNIC